MEIIPALVGSLKLAIYMPAESGLERRALLAATSRNERTLEQFVEQARSSGLDVHEEAVVHKQASSLVGNQPDAAGRDAVTVKIFRLTARRTP